MCCGSVLEGRHDNPPSPTIYRQDAWKFERFEFLYGIAQEILQEPWGIVSSERRMHTPILTTDNVQRAPMMES